MKKAPFQVLVSLAILAIAAFALVGNRRPASAGHSLGKALATPIPPVAQTSISMRDLVLVEFFAGY